MKIEILEVGLLENSQKAQKVLLIIFTYEREMINLYQFCRPIMDLPMDLLPRMESLSPLNVPLGLTAELDPEGYGRIIKVGGFCSSFSFTRFLYLGGVTV